VHSPSKNHWNVTSFFLLHLLCAFLLYLEGYLCGGIATNQKNVGDSKSFFRPPLPRSRGNPGTVTIPQYWFNKTKQHTHYPYKNKKKHTHIPCSCKHMFNSVCTSPSHMCVFQPRLYLCLFHQPKYIFIPTYIYIYKNIKQSKCSKTQKKNQINK